MDGLELRIMTKKKRGPHRHKDCRKYPAYLAILQQPGQPIPPVCSNRKRGQNSFPKKKEEKLTCSFLSTLFFQGFLANKSVEAETEGKREKKEKRQFQFLFPAKAHTKGKKGRLEEGRDEKEKVNQKKILSLFITPEENTNYRQGNSLLPFRSFLCALFLLL